MLKKYPFYVKTTVILFGLVLFIYALAQLRDILTPLSFALLLAILLNRLVGKLQSLKIPRTGAIILSMVFAFIAIAGIGYFLISQIMSFGNDLPVLKIKFNDLFSRFQVFAQNDLGIALKKQNELLNEAATSLKPLIGQTLGTVLGSLSILFLLPVYTFLLLYYKPLILNFIYEVFAEADSKEVGEVVHQTRGAIQRYMVGLLLEGIVVAVLNCTALLLLDVKYAILLGVIGAILNVLPYIGGFVAIILPVLIATVTKEGIHTQIGVTAAYLFIQFIDNHLLIPLIVSSKVKINALISIVIVLLGGAAWGISGMFLSIPFIGVLKIIFDRVPDLKPWGKLLGDEVPTVNKLQRSRRNKK